MTQVQILLYKSAFLFLLILHTFAGYSFCYLIYLQFRQYRLGKPVWGGWTWRALTLVFAVNYFYFLSGYLTFIFSDGRTGEAPVALQVAHVVTRSLIGPLAMQLFYVTERERLPRHWLWWATIRTMWAVALPVGLLRGLLSFGVKEPWAQLDDQLRAASDATAAAAGIFVALVILLSRRQGDSVFRRWRRYWYSALIVIGFALGQWVSPWSQTLMELVVLAFVLVTVYYGERLTFFDVFAKRGLLFFLSLLVLTAYLSLLLPFLMPPSPSFVTSWLIVLALLPLVMATPWLASGVSSWVDRVWLKRRLTSADAAAHFEQCLRKATSEQDLLDRAESSLSYIFQSKAYIDPGDPTGEGAGLRATIRVERAEWGGVRILPRADETPFLSQDAELLEELARSFGFMLGSLRQHDQRLGQEQRERELVLSAARSELKALRAQINPHFLFNALNTIAALIPEKPDQAEQTIEQLAEVFRYTLRRSDREWVRLAEEIEIVRSYLEIEQARFGDRLRVRIRVDGAAEDIRIPAMVIQTLTENAIKHGITAARGLGLINVSARISADKLHVRVEDSGPGFERLPRFDSLPDVSNGGYGLKNVQERLRAHYGVDAQIQFGRDSADEMTVVSFEIPTVVSQEAGE